MKKKLAFLLIIFTIILTLTSCDKLMSMIPWLNNQTPGEKTYTVSFSGADVSSQTVKSGDVATRPEDPTKIGYTFAGWYDADLAVEWIFTNPVTKDMTLYAKWEINVYDVSFDVEGYHQQVNHGDCPKVPETPRKEGWVFDGWYADLEYTIPFDFNKPITGETSAYAKWVRKTLTVNFIQYDYDNNDAVITYDTQTVEYGGTLTEPKAPVVTYGTFSFWRGRNGVPWDFSNPVYEDMNLEAIFMLNRYTVTYADSNLAPYEVNHGETIGNPVPASGIYGYVFSGWYADEELTVPFDTATPITSDITLYPKWEKDSYTVKFTIYYPEQGYVTYDVQTVKYEETLTKPKDPDNYEGGTFGWWMEKNSGRTWDFDTPITESFELLACFILNRYTITFANTELPDQNVDHGNVFGPPLPSKNYYTFSGWYTDEALTVPYDVSTVVKSDMTLYAKWIETYYPGDEELRDIKIFLVGDSTVSSFDDDYLFPRYGWGTQLGNYLSDKATVVNLALSGRSSKSFISEPEYQTLIDQLGEGDYLLIAFGHNDEKSDDAGRFTDATKHYTDNSSFGWHLYTYYIQLAYSKGATPILVTPIVRAKSNNDYSGSEGHVTATGDYSQAIINLGAATGVTVIDMTTITKNRYMELGYDEAIKYHAVLQGKYANDGVTVVEKWDTVDKTHLNIYGAKYVAYRIADKLTSINGIKHYIAEGITEPGEADRVQNPDYVVPTYEAPDLENYSVPAHFSTTTDGWYGTAFGDTGGSPMSAGNGYLAKETEAGVFQVGQFKSGSNKGKFSSTSDGFAFLFTQVEADKDFIITVNATVIKTASTKQAGFGLMLRDDCIINQTATDTIASNYVTAGIVANSDSQMSMNFYRENSSLKYGTSLSGLWAVGDTATFTIERIGQTVNVTVEYDGKTYAKSYYDFDFLARDTEYMYVGMFANRGTVVEFSNLKFTITGESQGA